ncbi:MAG: Na/Pi symporter [Betaproteobacteria bacterium]|nr:Na/Pi symporter [Betaproteobacteria bacterium]
MTDLSLIGGLAGGVGLFLLGMGLMTDGLKLAAGPALQRILAHSTKTPLRGLASGVLVTAAVQSSSAVTVAIIGFVNAGLLNLSQSLWVLFGANVGTTMTGWLVALVGLKFNIEVLALPLIGFGMLLRLSGEGSRRGALGTALAGFGVLFLGIDMLKDTFAGLSTEFTFPEGAGVRDILVQVLIGLGLTVLMQSSSASLAIVLTAAQGGLLSAQGRRPSSSAPTSAPPSRRSSPLSAPRPTPAVPPPRTSSSTCSPAASPCCSCPGCSARSAC